MMVKQLACIPRLETGTSKCQSHYWITRDTVRWAERWSDKKIRRVKESEQLADSFSLDQAGQKAFKNGRKKSFWRKITGK